MCTCVCHETLSLSADIVVVKQGQFLKLSSSKAYFMEYFFTRNKKPEETIKSHRTTSF